MKKLEFEHQREAFHEVCKPIYTWWRKLVKSGKSSSYSNLLKDFFETNNDFQDAIDGYLEDLKSNRPFESQKKSKKHSFAWRMEKYFNFHEDKKREKFRQKWFRSQMLKWPDFF